VALERSAQAARAEAEAALRSGRIEPTVFERSGAAAAQVQAKGEQLERYKTKKSNCEKSARSLRRQIEQLRGQLARYAEALEEDLTRGRNQVAERTREGLRFEKAFHEVTGKLLRDLRDKPECRDLLPDLLEKNNAAAYSPAEATDAPYSRQTPEGEPDSTRAAGNGGNNPA
jgi:serine/threonine-protein kinase